jgi:hypothetical protein
VSRGVVLWPDEDTTDRVRVLWEELETLGVRTLATRTHRRHRPHVSLVVGERLDTDGVLAAIGELPSTPIGLRLEAIGMFPQGFLYLACTPSGELLAEQERARRLAGPHVEGIWPYFEPGAWVPHVTISAEADVSAVSGVLSVVAAVLPIEGQFQSGGVEDGGTGERWIAGA